MTARVAAAADLYPLTLCSRTLRNGTVTWLGCSGCCGFQDRVRTLASSHATNVSSVRVFRPQSRTEFLPCSKSNRIKQGGFAVPAVRLISTWLAFSMECILSLSLSPSLSRATRRRQRNPVSHESRSGEPRRVTEERPRE